MYSSDRIEAIRRTVHADASTWTTNAEERLGLSKEIARCRAFIEGHSWCDAVNGIWLGVGISGVVIVCLVEIEAAADVDKWLWVVGGDVPSAYLVTDDAANPIEALEVYCDLMEDWANSVMSGSSLDESFPVRAPADKQHAADLLHRVSFIRAELIPDFRAHGSYPIITS